MATPPTDITDVSAHVSNIAVTLPGGSNIIFGSAFAEFFRGDAGSDTPYALGGANRFIHSAPGWGSDTINGFVQGQVRLDFNDSGIAFYQFTSTVARGSSSVALRVCYSTLEI